MKFEQNWGNSPKRLFCLFWMASLASYLAHTPKRPKMHIKPCFSCVYTILTFTKEFGLKTFFCLFWLMILTPTMACPPLDPQKALARWFSHMHVKFERNSSKGFGSRQRPLKFAILNISELTLSLFLANLKKALI